MKSNIGGSCQGSGRTKIPLNYCSSFVREDQREKGSAQRFLLCLHLGGQMSPENNSAATGTGGYSWISITPAPNSCVQRDEERHWNLLCPETQAWRSCRRRDKTIICLGHLQGFFKRNAWAKLSRLAELSCKFSCFSASQAALLLLSYAAGPPRNAVSQEWRTETEMFSKALCHSLLCCTATVTCCAGRNKSARLNQHLGCVSAPACELSSLQHSIPTAEAVSTAQGSHETCCGFGLKGFSFLSRSSDRTSFAANTFLLANTEILLCVRGWAL